MIEKKNDNKEQNNLSNLEGHEAIKEENVDYNIINTSRPLKDAKDNNINSNFNDNSHKTKREENIKGPEE